MKKSITLILTVFLCSISYAVDIAEGTKLYLTPNENWKTADARFAAYFFTNGVGDAWADMTAVGGVADLYELTAPAGTWAHVIFCRMNPATVENNWSNKWNQSSDLTSDGTNNHYTVAEGTWDAGGGTWSVYNPVVASVSLTIPSKVFIDETISFSSMSANVTDPVYTYTVKVPESTEFVSASSPYQPLATGTYTFKAEVAESTNASEILAAITEDVLVKVVPDPVTIKVIIPAAWTEIAFYNWNADVSGNFVTPELLTSGRYSYTFERMDGLNLIFVEGAAWPSDEDAATRLGKQTVNIEGITTSTCYEIVDATYESGDPDWGKRLVNTIDCNEITTTNKVADIDPLLISIQDKINVRFAGIREISIYSVAGQKLYSGTAENEFTYRTKPGVYLLNIDGVCHKVLVK